MAAETAHLRTVEQLIPTHLRIFACYELTGGNVRSMQWNGDVHSTHAKSSDTDEHTVGERDQRSERNDRTDDRAGHSVGNAIRRNWRNSAIAGFMPPERRLPRAWRATGARS